MHFGCFQAEESLQDEVVAGKACKRRIEHLKQSESGSQAEQNMWRKKRLDRMLVEYFLRAGYYNTAIQLAQHANIQVEIYAPMYRNNAGYIQFLFCLKSFSLTKSMKGIG